MYGFSVCSTTLATGLNDVSFKFPFNLATERCSLSAVLTVFGLYSWSFLLFFIPLEIVGLHIIADEELFSGTFWY